MMRALYGDGGLTTRTGDDVYNVHVDDLSAGLRGGGFNFREMLHDTGGVDALNLTSTAIGNADQVYFSTLVGEGIQASSTVPIPLDDDAAKHQF